MGLPRGYYFIAGACMVVLSVGAVWFLMRPQNICLFRSCGIVTNDAKAPTPPSASKKPDSQKEIGGDILPGYFERSDSGLLLVTHLNNSVLDTNGFQLQITGLTNGEE